MNDKCPKCGAERGKELFGRRYTKVIDVFVFQGKL